jgi:hypothetical protein
MVFIYLREDGLDYIYAKTRKKIKSQDQEKYHQKNKVDKNIAGLQ